MTGQLLLRGMLAGILAGIIAFVFLKVVGEPQIDRAIAFEARVDAAKARSAADHARDEGTAMPMEAHDADLVSRTTQAGIGLFTGVTVYGAALGGLFALVFAFAFGRIGRLGPRSVSAMIAAAGFIAVHLVPSLKYAANPPAVGEADTIGLRTSLYFSLVVLSVLAMIAALPLFRAVVARVGGWNAALVAGLFYAGAMLAVGWAMPRIDEVPADFPAVVLWQFRIASLGAQLITWATIGLVFGYISERSLGVRDHAMRAGREVTV